MNFVDIRLIKQSALSRGLLIAAVGCGLIHGILVILQAYLLSLLISQVFRDQEGMATLEGLFWVLLAVLFLRGLFTWFGEWYAGKAAIQVKSYLRGRLHDTLLALGPAYLQRRFTGDITNVMTEGVESLDAYISQYLPQLALAGFIPAVIAAAVFPLDLISGIVLILTAPLIPIFMVLISGKSEEMTRRHWMTLRRLSVQFLDTLQGLITLKALNQSKNQEEKIATSSDQYRRATVDVLQIAFLSALVLELVGTLSTAIIAVGIGLRLLNGSIQFQESLFILFVAPEFYLPLRQLGIKFHAGISGVTNAKRIFEILDHEPEGGHCKATANWVLPDVFKIQFKSVAYIYPDSPAAVFEDLSLQIPSGQMTALVGMSGSGKSTLLNLLLQFAQPAAGGIFINDYPINLISLKTWRNQISWISQSPYLFSQTILENIQMANPSASACEVEDALLMAGLKEFVDGLPLGLNTPIGNSGIRLSGGQGQSLALARAFLKNAPIVLLDEPTTMLDPHQEALIVEATRRLCKNRTVIVIAHRLDTIRQADLIHYFEKGKPVESGRHAGLLDLRGGYYRMVELLPQ